MRITFACIFLLFSLTDCGEWTPEADAYFILDGERIHVHLATAHTHDTLINFMGPLAKYIDIQWVSAGGSGNAILADGTYPYSYNGSVGGQHLRYFRVLNGLSKEYNSNFNSTGSMTVSRSDDHYTIDFTGNIDGHTIQLHYSGKIVTSNF